MARAGIAALVLLAACGGPVEVKPEVKKEQALLDVGTTWIYTDPESKQFTTRVETTAVIEGEACVLVRGASVGISMARIESVDVAYLSQNGKGEFVLHGVGEGEARMVARDPLPLFRKDAFRGQSWEGRFFAHDPKTGMEEAMAVKVVCGGETVIGIAAGEYTCYYVLEEWRWRGELVLRIENWWSDKVGLVKQIYRRVTDNGDRELSRVQLFLGTIKIVKKVDRR